MTGKLQKYKIAILIFGQSGSVPHPVPIIERLLKIHDFGVVKAVEVLDRETLLIGPILDQYKNTNLGMILLVASHADEFFPFSELEDTGLKNEKFLVTLNLDTKLEENFLKIIKKVASSPGKPYRGCDSSCR